MPTQKRQETREPEPDLDILEGNSETDYGPGGTDGYPVQVCVKGTVYTQEQPASHSADGSFNAPSDETQPAFTADPRRKELTLWCEDFPIYFGTRHNMVQTGKSAHLPAGGSATIRHRDQIWIRGDGGTALVSFVTELYAD